MSSLHGDGPCEDCGTAENIIWFTDNVFWNAVMPNDGILCILCFAKRAEAVGYRPQSWRVLPSWPWAGDIVPEHEQAVLAAYERWLGHDVEALRGSGQGGV